MHTHILGVAVREKGGLVGMLYIPVSVSRLYCCKVLLSALQRSSGCSCLTLWLPLSLQFDFSIFGNGIEQGGARGNKYPAIKPNYESSQTPEMYFGGLSVVLFHLQLRVYIMVAKMHTSLWWWRCKIFGLLPLVAGTATHSIDYRRSAGGFIHGFRYTTRSLFRHLEWKYHQVPWPSVTLDATDLTDRIIQRINEASVSDGNTVIPKFTALSLQHNYVILLLIKFCSIH